MITTGLFLPDLWNKVRQHAYIFENKDWTIFRVHIQICNVRE